MMAWKLTIGPCAVVGGARMKCSEQISPRQWQLQSGSLAKDTRDDEAIVVVEAGNVSAWDEITKVKLPDAG